MGKNKPTGEITTAEVNCLEYLVVAYNTVFLMSSIFLISIASTAQDLFGDFNRLLSPHVLLLIVGAFIVLIAALGYAGIGKKSSTLMSVYTMLLVIIFIMEISAGLGILSFKREIKSMVTSKMTRAMHDYSNDPKTANMVDFFQLELGCCGVNSYHDWDAVLPPQYFTNCKASNIFLPPSCCTTMTNSTSPVVMKSGCLFAINFMLHKSSLLLSIAIISICAFQALGAYFSYALATTLRKYKLQIPIDDQRPPQYDAVVSFDYKEKNNYI